MSKRKVTEINLGVVNFNPTVMRKIAILIEAGLVTKVFVYADGTKTIGFELGDEDVGMSHD